MKSKLLGPERELGSAKLSDIWESASSIELLDRKAQGLHLLGVAWRGFIVSPLTSLLSFVTISFSLFILAGFLLLMQNASVLVTSAREDLGMSIFLREGIESAQVKEIERTIALIPEVEETLIRTPEDALREFSKTVGEGSVMLEGLKERNPLPFSVEVRIRKDKATDEVYRRLSNEVSASPLVESVQYGKGVLEKLGTVASAIRTVGFFGVLFMLVVTGFIVMTTISLALYAHRDEIEIMHLVGASSRYIEAPFLLEGALQGFLGGLLSLLGVGVISSWLGSIVPADSVQLVSGLSFSSLGAAWSFVVVGAGLLTGLVGSLIAVKGFSRR